MNIWHISAPSFTRRVITVLSPALNQMCMHCFFLPSQFSLLLQQMANRAENKNIVFLKVDVDDAGVSGFWYYFRWHKLEESSVVCSFFYLEIFGCSLLLLICFLLQDVSEHCDIKCMPTFQFYKDGAKVSGLLPEHMIHDFVPVWVFKVGSSSFC